MSITCEGLQDAVDSFTALLDDYPPEKRTQSGACGAWSPREIIAHLTGWLKEAAHSYYCIADGRNAPISYDGSQHVNDPSVRQRLDLSWELAVAELLGTTAIFLYQARQLISDDNDARYTQWLDTLIQEFHHHTEDLQRFSQG